MKRPNAPIDRPLVDRAHLPRPCSVNGKPGTAIARITRQGAQTVLVVLAGVPNPQEFPVSQVSGI